MEVIRKIKIEKNNVIFRDLKGGDCFIDNKGEVVVKCCYCCQYMRISDGVCCSVDQQTIITPLPNAKLYTNEED